MKRITFLMKTAVALGVLLAACGLTQAQVMRSWVSGVGNDADPCSIFAPCKTLAGAYSKTIPGGQINVLDSDSVGLLKIDHSITIDASESFTGTLGLAGADAIKVVAGKGDVVTLRGLTLYGGGVAENGISFVSGSLLRVENCVIYGFTKRGIDYESSDANRLVVKDTIIRENGQAGILVQPGPGGLAKASVYHTRLEGNQNGLSVLDNAYVTISDSVLAGNNANGLLLLASAASTETSVENCLIAHNGGNGIKASGVGNKATVRLSGSTVTANDTGLLTGANGFIDSYGNNNIAGNTTDGVPSNKIPKT